MKLYYSSVGLGLISLDRCYPLTLGSNIGTTTTAVLASIAGEGRGLTLSVQVSKVYYIMKRTLTMKRSIYMAK